MEQGNLKGESVVAAILPSRMPVYVSPPNFIKRELPFRHGLKSRMQIGYCGVNHRITIMCADRTDDHAESDSTITHLHT